MALWLVRIMKHRVLGKKMSKYLILIVDDEPQNLALMRQILQKDYELKFAKSGEDALRIVGKYQPDLVLLDIQMPNMDGYEICTRIKGEFSKNIPVIFVSSRTEVGDEAKGFDVGASDYIIKPVIPELVVARVKTHLSLVGKEALEKSYKEAISMLSQAGHYNDTDTGLHIERMAAYARLLASGIGWSHEQ